MFNNTLAMVTAEGLTTRQTMIVTFLELRETHNRKPDMLEILNFISNQAKCEPIDVIRDVNTLIRKCRVQKVTTVTSTTYRIIQKFNNL